MSSFEEARDLAAGDVTSDSQSDTSTQAPDSGQAPVETQEAKPQTDNLEQRDLTTQEVKDVLDLGKLGRFKFEGKEMTYDELRKSYLRHQDYTKKTQEIAQERKFQDNLYADLQKVVKNPQLIAEFKQVYPEKYHSYLALVQRQEQSAQQSQTQNTAQSLLPEVLERLERSEQLLNSFAEESREATTETLNNMFETFEQGVKQKYPRADMVHVYSAVQNYLEENGVTSKAMLKNRKGVEDLFNDVAKSSHEARVKEFESWQSEKLEQAKQVNKKAGDIGRGGGTPSAPPQRLKIKDVADQVIADLN